MHDFSLFFKADCQMSERNAVFAVAPSLPIAVCAASIFDHNRRRFSDIGDDSAQHAALIAKANPHAGGKPFRSGLLHARRKAVARVVVAKQPVGEQEKAGRMAG